MSCTVRYKSFAVYGWWSSWGEGVGLFDPFGEELKARWPYIRMGAGTFDLDMV